MLLKEQAHLFNPTLRPSLVPSSCASSCANFKDGSCDSNNAKKMKKITNQNSKIGIDVIKLEVHFRGMFYLDYDAMNIRDA